jgi:hypothetical protein
MSDVNFNVRAIGVDRQRRYGYRGGVAEQENKRQSTPISHIRRRRTRVMKP